MEMNDLEVGYMINRPERLAVEASWRRITLILSMLDHH
jgi:hypothetical protein